jgi:hypothetical protein
MNGICARWPGYVVRWRRSVLWSKLRDFPISVGSGLLTIGPGTAGAESFLLRIDPAADIMKSPNA